MATQCTFANNYLFQVPKFPIVNVYNVSLSDGSVGRVKARFNNCIIYGLSPELNDSLDHFDICLRYCLLKSPEYDDRHFFNCIWEGNPCFLTVRDDQFFDYRLGNESDAIGKGNPDLCPEVARYDRYGNDRFVNGAIDLGAYVWIPVPEDEDQ